MSTFIISDTHFFHWRINRYCKRNFPTPKDMNDTMLTNWNSVVSKEDTVFHLGDFALGPKDAIYELTSKLNGYLILIMGNHDRHSKGWYKRAGFSEVYTGIVETRDFLLSHRPLYRYGRPGKFNVHGHIHNYLIHDILYINACVEHWNYTPFNSNILGGPDAFTILQVHPLTTK